MMKKPEFSIIVPVYKAEKTIHKCIGSILAQTIADFELILVNDGSPDKCGEICAQYASCDKRIKVINKENGGASDARNVGLDNAIGNLICFVDSDDVIDCNFLEIFKEKKADIVVQGMFRTRVRSNSQTEEYYTPIEEGEYDNVKDFFNVICRADNIGYLVTRAFKRDIIESKNLRLNTDYKLREDQEFILRYTLECKSFATINKGAYHYDVPVEFVKKYSHINQETNFLCMVSIIENFQKMADMPEEMITEYTNLLSEAIIGMYRTSVYHRDKMNNYLKFFCNMYRKCNSRKALSKKSKIVYHLIGTNMPKYVHRIYDKLFSII